jgi:hypothetical protein
MDDDDLLLLLAEAVKLVGWRGAQALKPGRLASGIGALEASTYEFGVSFWQAKAAVVDLCRQCRGVAAAATGFSLVRQGMASSARGVGAVI